MNAATFTTYLYFTPKNPPLFVRNVPGDAQKRMSVYTHVGELIATIIPNLGRNAHVLLFANDAETEFRGDFYHLAHLLSEYQQSGGCLSSVHDANNCWLVIEDIEAQEEEDWLLENLDF